MTTLTKIWWIATIAIIIIGSIPCLGWLNFWGIYLSMIGIPIGAAAMITGGALAPVSGAHNPGSLKTHGIICLIVCLIGHMWRPIRWSLGFFII